MKSGSKLIDELFDRLLRRPQADGPLSGHEVVSELIPGGGAEPGHYRLESHGADGSVKVETFRVDEQGQVVDVRVSVRKARPGPGKGERKKTRKPKRKSKRTET